MDFVADLLAFAAMAFKAAALLTVGIIPLVLILPFLGPAQKE